MGDLGGRRWPQDRPVIPWYVTAVKKVADHQALELIVIAAIVINTLTLAVQDPNNRYDSDFNDFLNTLDLVLTSIFTVEMFIRIFAMGLSEDTRTPYDVLFPGEIVQVCTDNKGNDSLAGEETQALCTRQSGLQRALRLKVGGVKELNPPESDDVPERSDDIGVRGWISAEEQFISTERRKIGGCCCCVRTLPMQVVNGIAILPEHPDLIQALATDSLPKQLTDKKRYFRNNPDDEDEESQRRAQRKRQFAKHIKGPTYGADHKKLGLPFPSELDTPCQPHQYAAGDKLQITQFARVTRGNFGGQMFELDDEALAYEKADAGKYFVWEWSMPGTGRWKPMSARSCEMLHEAKEKASKWDSQDGSMPEIELKQVEGFDLGGGITKEDYKWPDPGRVNIHGHMSLTSKQSKKHVDIRIVAIDIAYLSDPWNQLDFFVVITSWATFFLEVGDVELPFKTSSLRALRVMRVLRSMRFFSGIKTILSVLGQSVGSMGNIVGFLLFVYVILGIVGVQMFRGRLQYRCAVGFPNANPTGWAFQFMGIGDPNGPSTVFPDAPYCYPELNEDGNFLYNLCENECLNKTDIRIPSKIAGVSYTVDWVPGDNENGMFNYLDTDEDNKLDDDEVSELLQIMGKNAPRWPLQSHIDEIVLAIDPQATGNLTYTAFQRWWTDTQPCIPCYAARSCQKRTDPATGFPLRCFKFGNPGYNNHGFDNILLSWHAIFIMMTNLYWWETAYQLQDVEAGLGSDISWIFGFVIVLILSWVTVNMFVAVICDTYSEVMSQEQKFVDDEDGDDEESTDKRSNDEPTTSKTSDWRSHSKLPTVDTSLSVYAEPDEKEEKLKEERRKQDEVRRIEKSKRMIRYNTGRKLDDGSDDIRWVELASARPAYVDCLYTPPEPGSDQDGIAPLWRSPSKIILHPLFDNIIMLFIVFNTVTLSMEQFGMSTELIFVLARIGDVFNAVFIFEMLCKIFGMGLSNYLSVPFNCLDCFIVMTSILNYFGDLLPGASAARLLRIFRLFRIARVIRILYKYPSMKRLLNTVMGSGTALANLTLFIIFVVTVFAIMGMHLLGGSDERGGLDGPTGVHAVQRRTYEKFGRSWLMAFQTLTGDDWCNQMYAYVNMEGWHAAIFYAIVFIFNNYVLMNLFVAVILENFAIAEEEKNEKQLKDERNVRNEVARDQEARRAAKEQEQEPKTRYEQFRERDKALFLLDGTEETFYVAVDGSLKREDFPETVVSSSDGQKVVWKRNGSTHVGHLAKQKRVSDTEVYVCEKIAGKVPVEEVTVETLETFVQHIEDNVKSDKELREEVGMWPKMPESFDDVETMLDDGEQFYVIDDDEKYDIPDYPRTRDDKIDKDVLRKGMPQGLDRADQELWDKFTRVRLNAGVDLGTGSGRFKRTPEAGPGRLVALMKLLGFEELADPDVKKVITEITDLREKSVKEGKKVLANQSNDLLMDGYLQASDFEHFLEWWKEGPPDPHGSPSSSRNQTGKQFFESNRRKIRDLKILIETRDELKAELGDTGLIVEAKKELMRATQGSTPWTMTSCMELLHTVNEDFPKRWEVWDRVVKESMDALELVKNSVMNDLGICYIAAQEVQLLEGKTEYTNRLRCLACRVAQNPWFERLVMAAILLSSVLLAFEGPPDTVQGDAVDLLAIVDNTFYAIFMFEFCTKQLAYGFCWGKQAYIHDPWNRLDFVVVVFSTVNYFGESKSSLGRIFRLGRCLRPLRMINKFPALQVIVGAIVESLGTNTAVLGLSFLMYLIFGILGVNLFGGKFYSCTCGDKTGPDAWAAKLVEHNYTWAKLEQLSDVDKDGKWSDGDTPFFDGAYPFRLCEDGRSLSQWWPKDANGVATGPPFPEAPSDECKHTVSSVDYEGMNDHILCLAASTQSETCEWKNPPYDFDNIKAAIYGMFTASTLAGWTDLMEKSMDVVGVDQAPVLYNSQYVGAIYWVLFVFLLAFFITNLFLGVLIDFIGQNDGSAFSTDDQQKWTDLRRNTTSAKPPLEVLHKPEDPVRYACFVLCCDPRTSQPWTMLSNIAIGLNVMVMMVEMEGQSKEYEDLLNAINLGFLIYFTLDCVLKYVGFGRKMFILDPWNRFDAAVVGISWIGDFVGFKASVARAFRAFRIALILKNAKGLQNLFRTLINSVPPSLNILMLMSLLYSLYAILGMQIFGEVPLYVHLSEFGQTQTFRQSNFHGFANAVKTLFECSAGKDWKIVMYEVGDGAWGPDGAFFYFFTFFFFAVYILTNMFVAVIIDEFGSCQRQGSLPIKLDNMEVFQNVWRAHAIIHNSDNAIMLKKGKNNVNLRQLLKDVGLFTGEEERGMQLRREHEDLMDKYSEAVDPEQKKQYFSEAEDRLREWRVVDSDIFRTTLAVQRKEALNNKDFAKAESVMQQLRQLDEDVQLIQGNKLSRSCERVLKEGGTKDQLFEEFIKKASEKDLGLAVDMARMQDNALKKSGMLPRDDKIEGMYVQPDEMMKWDSGKLVPHPQWEDEEILPEHADNPAVIAYKKESGDVHPLWDVWFSRVRFHMRETEKNHDDARGFSISGLRRSLFGGAEELVVEEAEQEVHFLAVLEAVILASLELAQTDGKEPDDKKREWQKDMKIAMQQGYKHIKEIQNACSWPASASTNDQDVVMDVEWKISSQREKLLELESRKPENKDEPDNLGRTEAATKDGKDCWRTRRVRIRVPNKSSAIAVAQQSLCKDEPAAAGQAKQTKQTPFWKALTNRSRKLRIPGLSANCQAETRLCQPAGDVAARLVLFVTDPEPDPEVDDVADRVLLWCQANLGQHEVPSVVIQTMQTCDAADVSDKVEELFNPSAGLLPSKSARYPWELHSLLHSPGWSLLEAPETDDDNRGAIGAGELHEYEVMILKQAYQLFDPININEGPPYRFGWVTTKEFFIILAISQLYKPFNDPSHKDGSKLHPTKSMVDEGKGGEKLPGAYDLVDVDLHHQGVAIDWPEFLMVVARLKATGKLELDTEPGSPMAVAMQP